MKSLILACLLALTAVSEVAISALPTASVLALTTVSGFAVASQPAEAGGKGGGVGGGDSRRLYSGRRRP